MVSTAYQSLAVNLQRAEYFSEIYAEVSSGKGNPKKPYRELPRAGLVFAIGAFDSFLSDLTAEFLVKQLSAFQADRLNIDRARSVLKRVQAEIPTLAIELALETDPTQRIELAKSALTAHLATSVSNHGSKAVAYAVETIDPNSDARAFWSRVESSPGFELVRKSLDRRIKDDRSARKGRTKRPTRQFPKLKAAPLLEYWTERRHAIVHRGEDLSVWAAELEACIGLVDLLAKELDGLAEK